MLLGKVDVHDGDKEWHFFLLFVFSQTKKGYAKVVLGLLQVDKKTFLSTAKRKEIQYLKQL